VSRERRRPTPLLVCGLLLAPVLLSAEEPAPAEQASGFKTATTFLAGGLAGLGAHEAGHLGLALALGAHPNVHGVDFHGLPFFAIGHDAGLPRRQELAISSAGFWVQNATAEWLLTRHPRLREERAPFAKGMLAFDVLSSVAYAGAAFARTGPVERDTRGMADSARLAEPWVGAAVLAPALLDAYRYYRPEAAWARYASRVLKLGLLLLLLR
jgi:hypothetical protein